MGSTFGGINTALTSLYAQRRGLDVTGQNIANVNTEGYTRQRVQMQAQTGVLNPGVYSTSPTVGSGVSVSAVERGRNPYLEERGRTEHANSAYLANQTSAYTSIEDVLAEPSDTALQARLHDMWDGWNDVANNWQDPSTRTALIERAKTVATTMNDAYGSLSNQYGAASKGIGTYVDQVNTLAGSIADMNQQIVVAKAAGMAPNDLEDQRDRQIMQLSELAGATTSAQSNGAVNVYIGNGPVVSEFTARKLQLSGPNSLDAMMNPGVNDPTKVSLRWVDTNSEATAGGSMGSMVDTMNTIIPGITSQLDGVAKNLADTVNKYHSVGYSKTGETGKAFFTGDTAKMISVAIDDPDLVAFSTKDPTGDPVLDPANAAVNNGIADALTDVGAGGHPDLGGLVVPTDGPGPDQTYQQMIGQLGVAAQASGRRSEIQDSVTDQVDSSRSGESGVNLDEEMTHMLTYQRGYEAASRVLTTIDSMIDQIINRTGLVGR
jgi:flagellar hook-associated protein 1